MKKLLFILTIASAFVFVISGCEKSEVDEEVRINQMTFNGVSYDLSWGLAKIEPGESFINLYTKDMNYDSQSGLSGTGHTIEFEFLTASDNIEGSYILPALNNTNWEYGMLMEADLGLNYNSSTDNFTWYYMWGVGGELKISKTGDDYELIFEGTEEGTGRPVSVYYKGLLMN